MNVEVMQSKIHRACVTDANLEYEGSITIDKTLCDEAGLVENQKVDIGNFNNGARISTYIIYGGKGVICLNGPAARMACKNDTVVIISYAMMSVEKAKAHKPIVLIVDEKNRIINKKS